LWLAAFALGKRYPFLSAKRTFLAKSTFLEPAWDRCYDFKNIFAKKSAKKLAFLSQNKAKLCKKIIITLVFEKNAIFSPKIVENRRKL
jgi:hypothetical protein